MNISDDPYEQKLYQLFTSYDTESRGSLDREALSKLCQTLELKDRGPELIASLMCENDENRVSFSGFKVGLLNLLGTGDDSEPTAADHSQSSITSSKDTSDAVNQSPSREVSPKFIVGTKKYGRRTRPHTTQIIDSSQSESESEFVFVGQQTQDAMQQDVDAVTAINAGNSTETKTQKVQRSSSHSDIHGSKRRRPVTGSKLKRCASLPSQKPKNKDKLTVPIQPLQRESSVESLGNLDFDNLSHSLYDIWNSYGTDTSLDRNELESVCKRVGLEKIAGKVADEVFDKLGLELNSRISFNTFIALIQDIPSPPPPADNNNCSEVDVINAANIKDTQLLMDTRCSKLSSNIDGLNACSIHHSPSHDLHVISSDNWPTESSAVPSDVIIDMWESAGILNARQLLDNLGFAAKEIQISQLSVAIDEDLQGIQIVDDESTTTSLLRASLALHKAEVNALQQAFRQLADENRKLHANNRDANRRSALLAQEVDERHAHIENTAKVEIRLLEQRHADIVRDLTVKLASDREHWSSLNAKLEIRVQNLESEEQKVRNDLITVQQENSALEMEQISMQKQIADLLKENKKLNYEIVDVMERHRDAESFQSDKQSEEVLELIEKISVLQTENVNLRDKNDELTSEIEERCVEINRLKGKKFSRLDGVVAGDESTADLELSSGSATKRRGDSPSKAKISEESPKIGKIRKCTSIPDNEHDSEASGEWMTLNSELNQSVPGNTSSGFSQEFSSLNDCKDEEIRQLKGKIADLEKEYQSKNVNSADEVEVETIKERNCELEMCLEQMRKEYEDCEDYWQGKLNEERQLYEDEQRITNEKFNDLMKKMTEYEEQFALVEEEKSGRLSPIDEKCQLEQQYMELETEMEELKCQARKMLDEKTSEIQVLHIEINNLKHQLCRPIDPSEADSPASSPISYLWHQSTIQAPARDYTNPNWSSTPKIANDLVQQFDENDSSVIKVSVSPIQRPISPGKDIRLTVSETGNVTDVISVKSHESNSVASTHSVHRSFPEVISSSPQVLREDIKRLKLLELQLRDAIQELIQQRDCLVMEVEQLQEVKPMLSKVYARANHPSLMQKIQQLEQKNRQLLNNAKHQQMYTESILQQSWQQQNAEMNELRHRLEAQGIIIAEQAQRLANADLLVKDLYVENSQLSAAVQRLEQQRTRNNLIVQHQGLTVVPGMP